MTDERIAPKILEYEDGRVFITSQSLMIPEIKVIVDKFGETEAIPYLGYIYLMTWIHSPYRNYDDGEKQELVVYDVINSMGDFDVDDLLIQPAIDKLDRMNSTPLMLFFLEIEQELHRMRKYLKDNEITGGRDGDLSERFRILKEAGAITASYNKAKISAEEELKIKGRGKAIIGDY